MTNDYTRDARVILTLDAGGTNFVFSAICGQEEIVQPVRRPSHGNNLQLSLQTIVEGFRQIREKCDRDPVAISFAFPGPADYPNGVIEKLVNLPAFNGGVALGPMLQNIFHLPVYINNDGNLFGLGEAIAGFLPLVNRELEKTGSPKRFRNLVGVTLGTGFGGSVIIDGRMVVGDNSAGGEIWAMRNRLYPELSAKKGSASVGCGIFTLNWRISIRMRFLRRSSYSALPTGKRRVMHWRHARHLRAWEKSLVMLWLMRSLWSMAWW
jgi:glucokinase